MLGYVFLVTKLSHLDGGPFAVRNFVFSGFYIYIYCVCIALFDSASFLFIFRIVVVIQIYYYLQFWFYFSFEFCISRILGTGIFLFATLG
jgi:hypothetical protein